MGSRDKKGQVVKLASPRKKVDNKFAEKPPRYAGASIWSRYGRLNMASNSRFEYGLDRRLDMPSKGRLEYGLESRLDMASKSCLNMASTGISIWAQEAP